MPASQYMPDYLDRATSIARLRDFAPHWSAQVGPWGRTNETGTQKLDRAVDRAFGSMKLLSNDQAHRELLFANYQSLLTEETDAKAN